VPHIYIYIYIYIYTHTPYSMKCYDDMSDKTSDCFETLSMILFGGSAENYRNVIKGTHFLDQYFSHELSEYLAAVLTARPHGIRSLYVEIRILEFPDTTCRDANHSSRIFATRNSVFPSAVTDLCIIQALPNISKLITSLRDNYWQNCVIRKQNSNLLWNINVRLVGYKMFVTALIHCQI
jgi:hypothetical protein